MFTSIRSRLTFSHLTVIILAMGVSGFLLLSFFEDYFIQATENSLIAQARITAQGLIPNAMVAGPIIEDQSPLSNTMQQQQSNNLSLNTMNLRLPTEDPAVGDQDLSYLNDVSLQLDAQLMTRIRILDSKGFVIVDSKQEELGIDLSADTLISQALSGEYSSRVDKNNENSSISIALPIHESDQLISVIYLSQPLSDVISVLGDLQSQWVISMTIAMFLSTAAGLIFSGAITRPISQLTKAAGVVAKGQFDQQVQVQSQDEIGDLAQAFNDMTARLQAARQMQVDFVANVSHELRTPLTSVIGLVETLRNGAVDDPEVRDDFLETVENEANRLTRLVNDLLLLSQADSDTLNLQCQRVNLGKLIHDVTHRLEPFAESKGLSIETDVRVDSLPVFVDPDKIEQVLVNLLDNAIKFSNPGSTVVASFQEDSSDRAIVMISDEGIGIPEGDLDQIGIRFYRADKARSRTMGGSGLGLAIAQTLVEGHGGKLWVESQEGQGTQVSFTLPTYSQNLM